MTVRANVNDEQLVFNEEKEKWENEADLLIMERLVKKVSNADNITVELLLEILNVGLFTGYCNKDTIISLKLNTFDGDIIVGNLQNVLQNEHIKYNDDGTEEHTIGLDFCSNGTATLKNTIPKRELSEK